MCFRLPLGVQGSLFPEQRGHAWAAPAPHTVARRQFRRSRSEGPSRALQPWSEATSTRVQPKHPQRASRVTLLRTPGLEDGHRYLTGHGQLWGHHHLRSGIWNFDYSRWKDPGFPRFQGTPGWGPGRAPGPSTGWTRGRRAGWYQHRRRWPSTPAGDPGPSLGLPRGSGPSPLAPGCPGG